MIPKSVQRFSEKIMLKQEAERDDDSRKSHPALVPACGSWEQPTGDEKFDHVAVERLGLLDLAGMAGAVEDLQLAAGDALLQREGGPLRIVLARGDDDGRAGGLGVIALRLVMPITLELDEDGVDIAEHVAIGEQVGEEMGHRRRAESGAEAIEGVAPTVANPLLLVGLDARRDELLVGVVA